MPIIVSNIRIGFEEADELAIVHAIKKLQIKKSDITKAHIYKKSLDARRKSNICSVCSVIIELINPKKEAEVAIAASDPFVMYKENSCIDLKCGNTPLENPIVIIGFGPAGIFAADILSKLGFKPYVFERGCDMDKRVSDVNIFWKDRLLNSQSNVQFGEGGAGTFSDGKLTTRISDNRCSYVLERFVECGASEEILYSAKPHIGTDKLRSVIKNMRKDIIKRGGKVFFEHNLDKIIIKNGSVHSVVVNGNEISTNNVITAIGHSSRDTFRMLFDAGVDIENKSFSIGVRIEQLQATINNGLYGNLAGSPKLPQGEYQLSHRMGNHCVYTFCMCPGGYVVPASSSENSIVTNGMSEHSRDGKNANSALVVSVSSSDFGNYPLAGIDFQEKIEQSAFALSGQNYTAPALTVGDFLENKTKLSLKDVIPSYSLGVAPVDFNKIFSKKITDMMKIGLKVFDKKLKGFANPSGILTAPETRTSSPIRITRSDEFMSTNVNGLYPCGEGAGYAGGIMSAAVDGIRIAQKLASIYKPD